MDSPLFANSPRRFVAGGRDYRLSALSIADWADFSAFIKDNVPRPDPPEGLDSVECALFRRAWPPAVGSPGWWAALDHPACFAELVRRAIDLHRPGVSDAEALAIASAVLDEGRVGELILRCLGGESEPGDPPGPPPDPDAFPPPSRADEPGDIYFCLAKLFGWSHAEMMRLTFAQVRYYANAGRPPRRGARAYGDSAAARADQPDRGKADVSVGDPPAGRSTVEAEDIEP